MNKFIFNALLVLACIACICWGATCEGLIFLAPLSVLYLIALILIKTNTDIFEKFHTK